MEGGSSDPFFCINLLIWLKQGCILNLVGCGKYMNPKNSQLTRCSTLQGLASSKWWCNPSQPPTETRDPWRTSSWWTPKGRKGCWRNPGKMIKNNHLNWWGYRRLFHLNVLLHSSHFSWTFCIILVNFGLDFFFFRFGLRLTSWVVVEMTGTCSTACLSTTKVCLLLKYV